MSSQKAVDTEGLTKRYKDETAVDDLSLTVDRGEIYGFLGPNGAGKSTTINLLMDYIRPTEGGIRVLGKDPRTDAVDVHQRVGILPDAFSVYRNRTGKEHVELVIKTKRADDDPVELLSRVGLADAVDQVAGTYSRGMRQRLALAMALVGNPDLLILDEPFGGLDPRGVRTIREIAHEENDRGATVFFSSHVLGQVELVCDQIGILHDGQLVAEGSLESLRREAPLGPSVRVSVTGPLSEARATVETLDAVKRVSPDESTIALQLAEGESPNEVVDNLETAGVDVNSMESEQPSMESVFLAHTNEAVNLSDMQ